MPPASAFGKSDAFQPLFFTPEKEETASKPGGFAYL